MLISRLSSSGDTCLLSSFDGALDNPADHEPASVKRSAQSAYDLLSERGLDDGLQAVSPKVRHSQRALESSSLIQCRSGLHHSVSLASVVSSTALKMQPKVYFVVSTTYCRSARRCRKMSLSISIPQMSASALNRPHTADGATHWFH